MNSILNSDKFTSTRIDRYTGQPRCQWIEYADGVIEPVRRGGNLNKKHHGNKRTLDWWTMEKPLDWNPVAEGKQVSLNHDFGAKGKPQKMAAKASAGGGKAKPTPRSTLIQGAEGKRAEQNKPKTQDESWAYKLVPPLWKPKGHPSREWAEGVLKNKLEGFAQGFIGLPDPYVTPIQMYGNSLKKR